MQIRMPSENVIVTARNTLTTLNLSKLIATASSGFVAGIVGVNQLAIWKNIPSLESSYVLLCGGLFCGIVAVVGFFVDPKNRVVQVVQEPPGAILAPSIASQVEVMLPYLIDALTPHVEKAAQDAVAAPVEPEPATVLVEVPPKE